MNNLHPEFETLLGYSRSPAKASYSEVRTHIIACDQCRQELDEIHHLGKHLIDRDVQVNEDSAILMPELISAYLNKELSDTEFKEVEKLIETNQRAKSETLHYALHSLSIRDTNVLNENRSPEIKKKVIKIPLLASVFKILNNIFDRQVSGWLVAPTVATLVIVIVISNRTPVFIKQPIIATYQDEAVITYDDKLSTIPSIGFFGASRKSKKLFSGIDVNWEDEGELVFSWKPIPEAKNYTLTIFNILSSEPTIMKKKSNIHSVIRFEDLHFKNNTRYEWLINGVTTSNRTFEIKGGFIVKTD